MSRVEGYGFSPLALGCGGAKAVLTQWDKTRLGVDLRSNTYVLILILLMDSNRLRHRKEMSRKGSCSPCYLILDLFDSVFHVSWKTLGTVGSVLS